MPMRPSRAALRPLEDPEDLRRNACATEAEARMKQAEASLAQAEAMHRMAETLDKAIEAFQPAADSIHSLGVAQQKLCAFIVKNRLKLAFSMPAVCVAVSAISPTAAHAVAELLKAWV